MSNAAENGSAGMNGHHKNACNGNGTHAIEEKEKIRIMIVDDHAFVRAGLRLLLERESDMNVVAEAGDGIEACAYFKKSKVADLVIMDVCMPGLNGIDATGRIKKRFPSVNVLMLSAYLDDNSLLRSLKAGALGYALKQEDAKQIVRAVRLTGNGLTYFSPLAATMLRNLTMLKDRTRTIDEILDEHLTDREIDVLQLLVDGCSSKEIAFKLNLAPKTVNNNRTNLLQKTRQHNVAGLVRYAVQRGMVEINPIRTKSGLTVGVKTERSVSPLRPFRAPITESA